LLVAATASVAAADVAYTAKLDIVDKKGEKHAVLASKLTCTTPSKCPEWSLDLGRVEGAQLVGLVDLQGEPRKVQNLPATLPESAKLPVAFVRFDDTDGAGTHWERLAVVSLEGGRAKLAWRGELAMQSKNGGGFSTINQIELVATEQGKPLALEFAQTSVPAPGDKPFRPGPPLSRHFEWKDGQYVRR
jgi:hypothetical protein